jgi:hypothetical protein
MGSTVALAPAAGLTALGVGLLDYARGGEDPMEEAATALRDTENRFTFEPRTVRGQENLVGVAEGMESLLAPIEAGARWMGDSTLDATGSPAWATAAYMIPDILETLLGLPPALKVGKKLSGILDSVPRVAKRAGPGKYQTGSIGGSGAKGANPLTKRLTDDMTKQGFSPEQIWEATGKATRQPAWIDADNMFKFEFDDSAAGWKEGRVGDVSEALSRMDGRTKDVKRMKKMIDQQWKGYDSPAAQITAAKEMAALKEKMGFESDYGVVGAQFEHPMMEYHYPKAKDINLNEDYMPSNEWGEYNRNTNTIKVNKNKTPENNRETLLHELNHSIQDEEGFARGGSVSEFAREQNMAKVQAARYDRSMEDMIVYRDEALEMGMPEEAARQQARYDDLVVKKRQLQDKIEGRPFDKYENLLGEDEARAVEKRANLSMDERLARPFWMDMDSQRGNHIIRHN